MRYAEIFVAAFLGPVVVWAVGGAVGEIRSRWKRRANEVDRAWRAGYEQALRDAREALAKGPL